MKIEAKFNLSEKIEYGVDVVQPVQVELGEPVIKISKIKEFIRRLKEELETFNIGTKGDFKTIIDKLAGEKLK